MVSHGRAACASTWTAVPAIASASGACDGAVVQEVLGPSGQSIGDRDEDCVMSLEFIYYVVFRRFRMTPRALASTL